LSDCAALILAAGASTRLGRPKQLLDWAGRPLARAVAEVALAAGLDPVIAVVGAASRQVTAALAGLPLRIVENPAYMQGQSTSLRAGVAALPADAAAALVLLADQPFVTAAIVARIVAEWRAHGSAIVAPAYAGQRGNPVLFDRTVFPELLAVEGDQGARAILAANPSRIRLVRFDDPRPLIDIDTSEDYERLASSQ
jgi:molybdenum cofactor cytidylyltransferase